jgi:hypothetical protein
MRRQMTMLAVVGTLLAAVAAASAAAPDPAAQLSATKPAPALGTHSVQGIVKSVDASTLVIARSRRRPTDLAFALCGSTIREGQIAIGRLVSIRYVIDGDTRIATAVSAHPESTGRSADPPITKTKGGT